MATVRWLLRVERLLALASWGGWRTTSGRRYGWVCACPLDPSRRGGRDSSRPESLAGGAGAGRRWDEGAEVDLKSDLGVRCQLS
jgi:hypothetical protein